MLLFGKWIAFSQGFEMLSTTSPRIELTARLQPDCCDFSAEFVYQSAYQFVLNAAGQSLDYLELQFNPLQFLPQNRQQLILVFEQVIAAVSLAARTTGMKVNLIAELEFEVDDDSYQQQIEILTLFRPKLVALAVNFTSLLLAPHRLSTLLSLKRELQWPLLLDYDMTSVAAEQMIQLLQPQRVLCSALQYSSFDVSADNGLLSIQWLVYQDDLNSPVWQVQTLSNSFLSDSEQAALNYRSS